MFRFAHIELLYVLLAVPVIVLLFVIARQMRKRAIKRYGDISIISVLMKEVSNSRPVIKFIIIILAFAFLVFGIAGPQFGTKLEEVKREGVELVIALDVSNSMMAEDIQPNRLERAKRAISKLIDRLHNDRICLVVFAGEAYVQLPITTDYAAAKMFLLGVNPGIVPKQGTAIGSAIELAMKCFTADNEKSKAIIVITDGENHEDDAIQMATKACEEGIAVHAIGMGLAKGAPIPVAGPYGQSTFRTDKTGEVIISKLNENMLKQIAKAGEGVYIRASNTQAGLNSLFDEINKMEKEEIEAKVYKDYEHRFQYVFAIVLFLLLLDFVILERKNKLLSKINIFNIRT